MRHVTPAELIQKYVDDCTEFDDGWRVAHHVLVVGMERFDSDGNIETAVECFEKPGQAPYVSHGLFSAGYDVLVDTSE